nr:lipopolysaccharide biosynthesis protein [Membranihabitans marinus]
MKKQSISSLLFVLLEQFFNRGFRFVLNIVLARLLLPEDFGLIAIVIIIVEIGQSLVGSGMTASLIRSTEVNERDYSTVFVINLVSSIFLYGLLFVASPWIADFFNAEELTLIIRLLGTSLIIGSLYSVHWTIWIKELQFKTLFVVQSPALVISGGVGVIMAYNDYGLWSLLYMYLTQSILTAVFVYLWSDWRPRFIIDGERGRQHFDFGYKLALSSLLQTFFKYIYDLMIGKMYLASVLGLYNRAYAMQNFLPSLLVSSTNKIIFPLFSKMQSDDEFLKQNYKKLLSMVYLILTPALVFVYIMAENLFVFLLTDKWLAAVPYFQLLCVVGLLQPLQAYNMTLLKVFGRSDLYLRLEVIKKILLVLGLLIIFPYGIYGLLYFQIGYGVIELYLNAFYSRRFIKYALFQQFQDIIVVIIMPIVIGVLCYGFYKFFIYDVIPSPLLHCLVFGMGYGLLVATVAWIGMPRLVGEIRSMAISMVNQVLMRID